MSVTDIYDPRRRGPVIIFQQMDASEEDRRRQRNRIHVDLNVPYDQASARIDAAVAAGGRVLADKTPGRCTLADPECNELDIVTHPQAVSRHPAAALIVASEELPVMTGSCSDARG